MVRTWVKLGLRSAEAVLRHGTEAVREVIEVIERDEVVSEAVAKFREEFVDAAPADEESEQEVDAGVNDPHPQPAATPSDETREMLAPPSPVPVHNEPGTVKVNR